jgi:hypothetical protein
MCSFLTTSFAFFSADEDEDGAPVYMLAAYDADL